MSASRSDRRTVHTWRSADSGALLAQQRESRAGFGGFGSDTASRRSRRGVSSRMPSPPHTPRGALHDQQGERPAFTCVTA